MLQDALSNKKRKWIDVRKTDFSKLPYFKWFVLPREYNKDDAYDELFVKTNLSNDSASAAADDI